MSIKSNVGKTLLLEAIGVQKNYKRDSQTVSVLKGVSLQVQQGEMLAIMGASGAGKSTLLQILGTLDEPSIGKVYFQGKDVFSQSEELRCRFRNEQLGFVFQFHYLLPEFNALENVLMPALIQGASGSDKQQRAKDLLHLVGLSHRLHHKPHQLSGGECQRVALARALIMNPKLILADEPTGNLDSENSAHLLGLLKELNEKQQMTVVIVTHDLGLAGAMHRILHMKDGRMS